MTTRNAAVEEWQAYLTNRSKRRRDSRFLVHGRDPITQAVAHGWPVETLLYRLGDPELPHWARELLDTSGVPSIGLVPELMAELASPTGTPELVAVAKSRQAALRTFAPGLPGDSNPPVTVVIERPESAIRLGGVIRAAHVLGAAAVVISGPSADHYDPHCVRASAGSLFALPVFPVSGIEAVSEFRDRQVVRGIPTGIVGVLSSHDPLPGADERQHADPAGSRCGAAHAGISATDRVRAVDEQDFADATIVVIGDETGDPGAAWRDVCDGLVRIPAGGALSAQSAVSVALYEISRQRRAFGG